MNAFSSRLGFIVLVSSFVVGAAGCGKGDKDADKAKAEDKADKASADKVTPEPAKPPAVSAKKLPHLPLQADVGDNWKIEEEMAAIEPGARLSTPRGDVSIQKDGVGGIKKMTLDDEKKLVASLDGPPTEIKEEQLADGWVLTFKTPGILPYHATVYRNIGDASYRCVITAQDAALWTDGINACKSLRP